MTKWTVKKNLAKNKTDSDVFERSALDLLSHVKIKNYFDLIIKLIIVITVALAALKRKKRYEKQLQQIDGTLSTIEFQREALENASTNTEVLNVMGAAAKALKVAHGKMYVKRFLSKFRFNSMQKS